MLGRTRERGVKGRSGRMLEERRGPDVTGICVGSGTAAVVHLGVELACG